jgi:hypothetical protein
MSISMKVIRDQVCLKLRLARAFALTAPFTNPSFFPFKQPVNHEGTLSTHRHSSSDKQRHSGIYDESFENVTWALTCISHRLPS